jgi:predicted alpha/beta-hydrolase family hydrolase
VTQIPLRIDDPTGGDARTGLQDAPTLILAHGAGTGMDSPFMQDIARSLAAAALRVVRFEFPYMRESRKTRSRSRPDPTKVLEETWLQVIEQVGRAEYLVIGGKSMGGRIASMVADRAGVRGLVCLGYPFHPAGRPEALRVAHLEKLRTRTLILQGTRDTLGSRDDIAGYALSPAIRLVFLEDGDHSFKPRKSSGLTFQQNFQEAVAAIADFCRSL